MSISIPGVNNIVRHFQWVSQVSVNEIDEDRMQEEEEEDDSQQQPQYFLKVSYFARRVPIVSSKGIALPH